ncbi:hypothetical protein BDV93DRAFT_506407 [Ceratobasidium sp. AG-I]|nr:hypothetical protein BDV93DRAFT_506407 [Ceratobasidium sp. AG-I]
MPASNPLDQAAAREFKQMLWYYVFLGPPSQAKFDWFLALPKCVQQSCALIGEVLGPYEEAWERECEALEHVLEAELPCNLSCLHAISRVYNLHQQLADPTSPHLPIPILSLDIVPPTCPATPDGLWDVILNFAALFPVANGPDIYGLNTPDNTTPPAPLPVDPPPPPVHPGTSQPGQWVVHGLDINLYCACIAALGCHVWVPMEGHFLWCAAESMVHTEAIHPGLLAGLLFPGGLKKGDDMLEPLYMVLDFCNGWFVFTSQFGLVLLGYFSVARRGRLVGFVGSTWSGGPECSCDPGSADFPKIHQTFQDFGHSGADLREVPLKSKSRKFHFGVQDLIQFDIWDQSGYITHKKYYPKFPTSHFLQPTENSKNYKHWWLNILAVLKVLGLGDLVTSRMEGTACGDTLMHHQPSDLPRHKTMVGMMEGKNWEDKGLGKWRGQCCGQETSCTPPGHNRGGPGTNLAIEWRRINRLDKDVVWEDCRQPAAHTRELTPWSRCPRLRLRPHAGMPDSPGIPQMLAELQESAGRAGRPSSNLVTSGI